MSGKYSGGEHVRVKATGRTGTVFGTVSNRNPDGTWWEKYTIVYSGQELLASINCALYGFRQDGSWGFIEHESFPEAELEDVVE